MITQLPQTCSAQGDKGQTSFAAYCVMQFLGGWSEHLMVGKKGAPRSVGVQSQCTDRRPLLTPKPLATPRFQVVEEFYQISERAVG